MEETINKIDEVMRSRQYSFFRLLDLNGKIIVPPIRLKKEVKERDYLKRWDFIKHKLYKELPVGKYILNCYYDVAGKNSYDYEIDKKELVPEEAQTTILKAPEHLQTTKNTKIMDKEYIDLVRECEGHKAEKMVLILEVGLLKDKIKALEEELEEVENLADSGATGGLLGGLNTIIPVLTPLLEKFMEQRDRSLNLQEKTIQNSPKKSLSPSNLYKLVKKEPAVEQRTESTEYELLIDYYNDLINKSPEVADMELDKLETENLPLYNKLMNDLNLSDNESENE